MYYEEGRDLYNKFEKDKFLLWLSYYELKTGTIMIRNEGEKEKAKID